jgi:hypothetical protein
MATLFSSTDVPMLELWALPSTKRNPHTHNVTNAENSFLIPHTASKFLEASSRKAPQKLKAQHL